MEPADRPLAGADHGGNDHRWRRNGHGIGAERDPERIGINVSRDWPVADGLTQGLHAQLLEVLPPDARRQVLGMVTQSDLIAALYKHIALSAGGPGTTATRTVPPHVG